VSCNHQTRDQGRIQFSQRRLSLSHSMTGIAREDAHRDEAALGLIQNPASDRSRSRRPTHFRIADFLVTLCRLACGSSREWWPKRIYNLATFLLPGDFFIWPKIGRVWQLGAYTSRKHRWSQH
jgi:hypothetical protein